MPDDDALALRIGELIGAGSLACAESCTAGLVAQALARVTGSLEWFRGGVIAYQRGVKYGVLGLSPGPVVTAEAAEQMARGVAELLDADVAVSTTGAAGPDPLDGVEPGTVFVGVFVDGRSSARMHRFDGEPAEVCAHACASALRDLAAALETRTDAC